MLSYVNLILIIVLTISLIVGFYLVKQKYEEDIDMQDERLIKLLGQLNKNDKYLKEVDIKNKKEVQELITKNSNDLGENRGLIADNIGLVDAVVDRLDTAENEDVVEGFQSLTVDEIKARQSTTLQNIANMKLPSGLKKQEEVSSLLPQENPLVPPEQPDDDVQATLLDTTTPSPLDTPTDSAQTTNSGSQQSVSANCNGEDWTNKPELNFNADCSNATNVGDTCLVSPISGYVGGRVECTIDGWEPTPANAIGSGTDSVAGAGAGAGTGAGTGTGTGTGTGAGAGTGTGAGAGAGAGTGAGSGDGTGTGTGAGAGAGAGTGAGSGDGTGTGTGAGAGAGTGAGSGDGSAAGSGAGAGAGSVAGSGDGSAAGSGAGAGTGSVAGAGTGADAGTGSVAGTGTGAGAGDASSATAGDVSSAAAGDASSAAAGDVSSAAAGDASSAAADTIISRFTLLSENEKCQDDPSYMANADGSGGFMNYNITTKENCSELCNNKNDCKYFSYSEGQDCNLYNENCNLESNNSWKTFKKNDSTEAFKQFIPFMHTQKGVTTATEAFFQPLTTKC